MNDVKWDKVQNCELLHVYKRLPMLFNEYTIELVSAREDSCFNDYHKIKIQSSKLYEELLKLKEGKIERCYFAYNMADIDIYTRDNKYIIMNSPTEASYHEYELSASEFDKLLNILKSEEC